jgi:hypothetical protein
MIDQSKTTNSTSPYTQEFAKIIRRYKKHCLYIKRLLEETDKSYNEINDKRVLTTGMKDFFNWKRIDFFF